MKELSTVRKNNLANSLLYATFNRDVAEVGGVGFWVVPYTFNQIRTCLK